MDNDHIERMIIIRNLLQRELPEKNEYSFFLDIVEKVQQYIEVYCQHTIIEDLIDVDPDRSKTIYYCTKCETTFDNM